MTRRIIAIFLLALAMTVTAGAAELTDARKQEVIARINSAVSRLHTMSCSFVQTKHLSLLSDKMVSEGRMYYSQPDRLRWEYTSPYKYLFIFNGNKVYVGNDSRKDVIDTNTNKIFKEVARIMMSTVTGTALSNAADFDTEAAEEKGSWVVTLVPRKKEMRRMFAKITMTFSKSASMISELSIYEKNGDRTDIKFKDVLSDAKVDESLFSIP
jgi:Outer membrane lipoprotein-sorting protein